MSGSVQLVAIYTAPFRRIRVVFLDDESAEVSSMGEVSEAEELAAVAAGGAQIPGWSSELL